MADLQVGGRRRRAARGDPVSARIRRSARAGAVLAAGLLAAAPLAAQPSGATRPRTAYEDLQMFSQVLNQIRVNHPDSVDYAPAVHGRRAGDGARRRTRTRT